MADTTEFAYTYLVDHPAFNEPIMLDSHFERSDRSVKIWAAMWLEKTHPDKGWDWLAEINNMTVEEEPEDAEQ